MGEATPPLEDVAAASHTNGLDLKEQKRLPHFGRAALKQEAPKQAKMKKRKRKPQPKAQQAAEGDGQQHTERAAPMPDRDSDGEPEQR